MRSVKILVVEDDENFGRLLQEFLESKGYQVFSAGNGLVALEIIRQFFPDVVISDFNMPGLNGYEFYCETVKYFGPIRFIFMTGKFSNIPYLRGLGLDALEKPFYFSELHQLIEKA